MARLARGEYLDPQTTQIVHATSRCVRRAFLCGNDPYSGKSYEHRREWIRNRLEFMASIFAIDCLTFAIMSNHLHLILRSRPDIVRTWSDREVAQRWLRLCPPYKDGRATKPTEGDFNRLMNDPRRMAQLRIRMSDISWWMRLLAQKIGQRANKEDGCTGRFWEGRYKAQLLLDEAAILACAMYVDLNPIRAAMAQSLEDSHFTGAKDRIEDLKESKIQVTSNLSQQEMKRESKRNSPKPAHARKKNVRWERSRGRRHCGWLSPIEINEASDPVGPDPSKCGRRASLRGFLTIPVVRYLELLDWTGRQLQSGKRGAIPSHVAAILDRLGIKSDRWLALTQDFGRLFKRAAGHHISLCREADRRNQSWLQAPGADCFV